jgi:hypothetical protein
MPGRQATKKAAGMEPAGYSLREPRVWVAHDAAAGAQRHERAVTATRGPRIADGGPSSR